MDFITAQLTPWHWMTCGILLCALELIAPTTILLWPGVAAIATGLITAAFPLMGWQLQVALFAVLAIVSTIAGRAFYQRKSATKDVSTLNRRADSYVGREVNIEDAIVNGVGSVYIGTTRWRVVGPDTTAGTQMIVTGLDGSSLIVRALETSEA